MMLRATHVAPRSSRLQPFASSSGSACLAPPPCSSSSLPGCSGTSRRPSARLDCQTPPPGGNTASRQPGIAPRGKSLVAFASQMAQQASPSEPAGAGAALICTSVTAPTVPAFIEEIREAVAAGVDVVELRLDFLKDFDVERDLELLMAACPIPYIVTYRPKWEG